MSAVPLALAAVPAAGVVWELARTRPNRPSSGRQSGRVSARWTAGVQRSLPQAWTAAGLKATPARRLPRVSKCVPVTHGAAWTVNAHGWDIAELGKIIPQVASSLAEGARVGVVELQATPGRPGRGTLTVLDREPLLLPRVWRWKPGTSPVTVPTQALHVGWDRRGEPATIPLVDSNGSHRVLIGGQSGTGKSKTMLLLLWQAMACPDVRLWLIDRKYGLEFAPLRARAHAVAETGEETFALLCALRAEVEEQAQRMKQAKTAKLTEFGALNTCNVLAIDELSLLRDEKKNVGLLEDLTKLGRAMAVPIIAALQVTSVDQIKSEVRALFDTAVAHRVRDVSQASMILGHQPVEMVPPGGPGLAILSDGQRPDRMIRVDFVGDDSARLEEHACLCAGVGMPAT